MKITAMNAPGWYVDDYYIDDDGELVKACPECPFFEKGGEDHDTD